MQKKEVFVLARYHINIGQEKKNLKNKIVLVTGAGGSIGSELVVQLLISGSIVIALDHSELSLYNLKILKHTKKFTNLCVNF